MGKYNQLIVEKWNAAVYRGIELALKRGDKEWANFLRGQFI